MPLNIKNMDVERLVEEISELTGESKTEAVRRALEERRGKLAYRLSDDERRTRLMRFLQDELWPSVPAKERGRRISREEEDSVLGYGPGGV